MNLQVLTPDKTIYEGEVDSVIVPGSKGSFEVLHNHAPIVSSLNKGEVRIKSKQGSKSINIDSGFIEVLDNKVVILAEGIAQ